jgi:hypothetical protein
MTNNTSDTSSTNEKRCEYCGSDKTYLAVTKAGTPYPKWNSNPFKEDSSICGRCYRNHLYHKALPPSHARRSIRIDRIAKRVCHKCDGKTSTQKNVSTSYDYHNWHRHPTINGKWLCARCHSNRINEPKKKFKTKEERYQYISKLFSATGNPQYGNHTLNVGRVYTEERNRRVSEAVKKWAKLHPEHYSRIGVLGALKARKMGLSGLPTGLEIIMKKALRKHKTSRNEWKNATASEVWKKDRFHNDYLKSKGYVVVRFWEREIEFEIDKCIKHIKKGIQAFKERNLNK